MFNLNQTSVILLIIVVSRERYAFLVSRYQYDHGSYRLWSSQLSQIGVNLVFLDCCYPYISNLISIDWCYSDFHRLATSQFFHTRIISDSNKWCHPGIHLFDLVSFFCFRRLCHLCYRRLPVIYFTKSKTTGATSGAGTTYSSGAPKFTPHCFQWGQSCSIFNVLCSFFFCESLFFLLSFLSWPLCCLFFYDLGLLITPLVSSNLP